MKTVKISQVEQENNVHKVKSKSHIFFYYISKLKTFQQCQSYLKKNCFSFKIEFSSYTSQIIPSRILERSCKYLRGLRPYLPRFKPHYKTIKQAKSLKEINFLDHLNYFESKWTLSKHITQNNAKKTIELLFRGEIALKRLKVTSFAFIYLRKSCFKKLKQLYSLSISSKTEAYAQSQSRGSIRKIKSDELKRVLTDITLFNNLTSVSLDLSSNLSPLDEGLFYEIFQNLSYLTNLVSLRIRAQPERFANRIIKMKKTMEKFVQLRTLGLHLDLQRNPDCENIFPNLLPLNNLNSLTLYIESKYNLDCAAMARFIASLKTLTELKLTFASVVLLKNNIILKGLQKLENLKSLTIKQGIVYGIANTSLGFEIINETLLKLESLQKFNIELGQYVQDPLEMKSFLKLFEKLTSLQEAKFCLNLNTNKKEEYEFDDEFFQFILSMIFQLKKLRIQLKNFPEEISKHIKYILCKNGRDMNRYCCRIP